MLSCSRSACMRNARKAPCNAIDPLQSTSSSSLGASARMRAAMASRRRSLSSCSFAASASSAMRRAREPEQRRLHLARAAALHLEQHLLGRGQHLGRQQLLRGHCALVADQRRLRRGGEEAEDEAGGADLEPRNAALARVLAG